MTFAVIKTGGKQYKVTANDTLRIEKLNKKPGEKLEFKDVLLTVDKDATDIGSPIVEGAKVEAELLKQERNNKIIVFKKRRRQNSRRRRGHRQDVSIVKILKIYGKNGKLLSESSKKIVEEGKETKTTVKKKIK